MIIIRYNKKSQKQLSVSFAGNDSTVKSNERS